MSVTEVLGGSSSSLPVWLYFVILCKHENKGIDELLNLLQDLWFGWFWYCVCISVLCDVQICVQHSPSKNAYIYWLDLNSSGCTSSEAVAVLAQPVCSGGCTQCPSGTVQFVLKLCCHNSVSGGTQVKQMKSSPGISAICAASCYLKAESDVCTVQEESFCEGMKLWIWGAETLSAWSRRRLLEGTKANSIQ